jgi:hypothetical protein
LSVHVFLANQIPLFLNRLAEGFQRLPGSWLGWWQIKSVEMV